MKRILFIIALLVAFSKVYSQVPGYMGKRACIILDPNLAPAFFSMNKNHVVTADPFEIAKAHNSNLLAVNYRPQVTFEYLVGRDVALGISYSQIITGTMKEVENRENDAYRPDIIRGQALGINIKFYKFGKSASIAPIGFYNNLTVAMARVNSYNDLKDTRKQFKNDLYYPVLTYGFGKQTIVFDRVIIGTGAEFSWVFVPTDYFFDEQSNWTKTEESISNFHGNLLGYYLFNFKISVGLLTF